MQRVEFAQRIASGLAGWFQQLAAQDLERQVGEDAARVEIVRLISALRSYVPDTAARPTNWPPTTKKRVDIAVLGKSKDAKGWYGAVELKWPGESVDVEKTRQAIVEDAIRVAFSSTANLCANFVVVGGTMSSLSSLFDTAHPYVAEKESQRLAFNRLFSRDSKTAEGFLKNEELNTAFPDCGDRVPQEAFDGWTRRLKAELVASANVTIGSTEKGKLFVWQCKK